MVSRRRRGLVAVLALIPLLLLLLLLVRPGPRESLPTGECGPPGIPDDPHRGAVPLPSAEGAPGDVAAEAPGAPGHRPSAGLTVVVEGEDGEKLEGATVGLYSADGNRPIVGGSSKKDGSVRFSGLEAATVVVRAMPPRGREGDYYPVVRNAVPIRGQILTCVLPLCESVAGIVVDETGAPIPRRYVRAVDSETGEWRGAALADDAGRFELRLPPRLSVDLVVDGSGLGPDGLAAPRQARAGRVPRVSAPATGVRIVAGPVAGRSFAVLVRDPDGRPAAGVLVFLAGAGGGSLRTGEDGRAVYPNVPEGERTVQVLRAEGDRLPLECLAPAIARFEADDSDGEVGLLRGAPVSGIVRDEAGRPVASARVDVAGFDEKVYAPISAGTDAEGRFRVGVPPGGPWRLLAWRSIPGRNPDRALPRSVRGGDPDVVLVLESP